MATEAYASQRYRADQTFFVKLAIVLSVLIVFGFAQFAARGLVDYTRVPVWVHLHGAVMVSWLALFVTQNRLAATGDMELHRRLGWIAAYLVVAIVGLTSFAGIMAIRRHTTPPFFTDAYFLPLTQVGAVTFGGLVFAAIARRRETEYHRRLMTGAVVILMDPALGRLLPMPFMIGWGEWVTMAIQLLVIGVIADHDRRTLGRVHPATLTVGAIIAMAHVLIEVSSTSPWVAGVAASIAGG